MLTRVAGAVVALLGAGTLANVALALGAGTGSIRRGHEPVWATVLDSAALAAVLVAFVVGGGSFRFPRSAGAANLVALPVTSLLTITYLGH